MKNFYKKLVVLISAIIISGSLNAQTQLVTDGSFEAGPGSGSGAWVESSTTFTTPICDLVNCGNGSGTGPNTGNYWAWFGGVSGNTETGSLTQQIVIPLGGTATLSFWIEQILCDGPQDFIEVAVDGNVVFMRDGTSSLCGILGYSYQSIDISTYADGNTHILSINSTTFSAFGTQSNFFIDDVSVIHNTGAGGSPCADTTTFASINVAIPDNDVNGISNVQTITAVPGTLGVNVQLKSVCFKLDHTWIGDLIVSLIAPNGTEVFLTDRIGVPVTVSGCDGDNIDVCVNTGTGVEMEGVCSNLPAVSGLFTAVNGYNLDDINTNGGAANGNWQLVVSDNNTDDTGSIIEWSLVFDDGPVANWNSPDTICATAGTLNLDSFVAGTAGGTWSGSGVTGSTFDPAGLSGPIAITYAVSNISTGCSDSETNIIEVISGPPTPGFSFSTISLTAIFNNFSSGGTSYFWNFGDAINSTEQNPIHTYAADGIYTVTLTVTNACGFTVATQLVTVAGCPDIIVDGGFEAGPGSGAWVETSTNLSTPVCDFATCGLGGGTGPRTGAYWTLFGGFSQFEESSVSQSITIAINSNANLYFWLELPSCDDQNDFLKIAVDADTVWSVNGANNLCGTLSYSLQNVNLSAYDDGLPHTLKFISKVYGLSGGITSFFVDDISLIVCQGIGFSEINANYTIDIMPVPAHDFITINFKDLIAADVKIAVSDMLGKNIYNSVISQVNNNQSEIIDVTAWNKGIYMLKITSGKNSVVRKIVIE